MRHPILLPSPPSLSAIFIQECTPTPRPLAPASHSRRPHAPRSRSLRTHCNHTQPHACCRPVLPTPPSVPSIRCLLCTGPSNHVLAALLAQSISLFTPCQLLALCSPPAVLPLHPTAAHCSPLCVAAFHFAPSPHAPNVPQRSPRSPRPSRPSPLSPHPSPPPPLFPPLPPLFVYPPFPPLGLTGVQQWGLGHAKGGRGGGGAGTGGTRGKRRKRRR